MIESLKIPFSFLWSFATGVIFILSLGWCECALAQKAFAMSGLTSLRHSQIYLGEEKDGQSTEFIWKRTLASQVAGFYLAHQERNNHDEGQIGFISSELTTGKNSIQFEFAGAINPLYFDRHYVKLTGYFPISRRTMINIQGNYAETLDTAFWQGGAGWDWEISERVTLKPLFFYGQVYFFDDDTVEVSRIASLDFAYQTSQKHRLSLRFRRGHELFREELTQDSMVRFSHTGRLDWRFPIKGEWSMNIGGQQMITPAVDRRLTSAYLGIIRSY